MRVFKEVTNLSAFSKCTQLVKKTLETEIREVSTF